MTKIRNFLVRMVSKVKAEHVKPFSPRMFAKTDKVYASAKHSVVRGMCVDPDEPVFTLAQIVFFIFIRGFSQLTYKDFLQYGGETVENNRNPV